jgi:two-component system sensor histidine kinase/response regulator
MSASDSRPAIDHVNGVARLMGDAALFARVLARFRKAYGRAADGIRGALAANDLQLAQRLAHTLKGAAGMIEAAQLREAVLALEQSLRHGAGDHAAHLACLDRLAHALDRVLREVDAAEASAPAVQPAAQMDAHKDVAARLRALLEDGNGDAVDLVQEAAASLTRELGEECYRQIAAAIEVFDFEGALALLNRRG